MTTSNEIRICPACKGSGLHQGAFVASVRPDCRTCNGRGSIRVEVEADEIGANRAKADLDWQGMARDLAGSLTEANRNIDRLVACLIEVAEAGHQGHGFNVSRGSTWQDCRDERCRKVAEVLASLVESKPCKAKPE